MITNLFEIIPKLSLKITSTNLMLQTIEREWHCHRIWYTIAFGPEYCQVRLKLRHFVQMRNIASLHQLAHTSICLHYFYGKVAEGNERKVVLWTVIPSALYILVL